MESKQISTPKAKQPARKQEAAPAKRAVAKSSRQLAPATPGKSGKAPAKTAKKKTTALQTVQDTTGPVIFNPSIVNKMKGIIASYTDQPEMLDSITSETDSNFTEVLNIDSVDVVEIIIDTEKEFGITIEDEEIKNMKTFKLLYLLVAGKIEANNN